MEEKLAIKTLQIFFQSKIIRNLKIELYDFSDSLLRTNELGLEERRQIPITSQLRNFYLRLINQDNDISELFSYFWPEGQAKESSIWLSQEYGSFVFKIQITVQQKSEERLNSQEIEQQEISPESMAKDCLGLVRERVFKNLQVEQFFKVEEPSYRCNFVRKKNHKNLTALLIKNSGNILRTLNQNIKSSSMLKSFSKIKITEETLDQASFEMAEMLEPPAEKKKVNSAIEQQKKWSIEEQAEGQKKSQMKEKEELPQQIFLKHRQSYCRPVQIIKKSLFVHKMKKKTYENVLEKQTKVDLKNQKETLVILKTYIQDWKIQPNIRLKKLVQQKTKQKIRI